MHNRDRAPPFSEHFEKCFEKGSQFRESSSLKGVLMLTREAKTKIQGILTSARRDMNLSCEVIASALGNVTPEEVRHWFVGRFPRGEQLRELCQILGVDADEVERLMNIDPLLTLPTTRVNLASEISSEEFSWLANLADTISKARTLKLELALKLLEARRSGE